MRNAVTQRLAECSEFTGRNLSSISFPSNRRTAIKFLRALKAIWKYDLQKVGSLSILKEISKDTHIKYFACQLTAVVLYSIHEAAT